MHCEKQYSYIKMRGTVHFEIILKYTLIEIKKKKEIYNLNIWKVN